MNEKLMRILKIAAAALVILMLVSQLYKTLYNPFTTETVMAAEYYDGIDVVGLVLRDETIVTADVSGVISYPHGEGSHVSKDGIVANLFETEEAANAYLKVRELEQAIATLRDTQSYNDLYAANLDLLENKILTSLVKTLDEKAPRFKIVGQTAENDLANYLNRKQIVTGQATDFDARIAALEAEKAAYEAQYTGAVGAVRTDTSGYCISVVDGYENAVDLTALDTLTPAAMEDLTPAAVPENVICKIVSDYHWFLAAEIDIDDSLAIKEGSTMKLRTALRGYTELPVTVEAVNREGEKAVVVFQCKILCEELAGTRNLPVTIVKENYEGLRVDNRALHAVDGVRGVYVYRNSKMTFVPVELLYSGSYSIVKKQMGQENALRLYDEIIVKGRNLYDGKIVS